MVYEGSCGGAGRETQGSNPWNIYGNRAAPIFICYEKSRLRRARGRPEKYTPVISLYLQPIRSLPLRGIRSFLFGETVARRRAFSHRPPCARVRFSRPASSFHSAPAFAGCTQGKTPARLSPREGPLLSSRSVNPLESLNVASETC